MGGGLVALFTEGGIVIAIELNLGPSAPCRFSFGKGATNYRYIVLSRMGNTLCGWISIALICLSWVQLSRSSCTPWPAWTLYWLLTIDFLVNSLGQSLTEIIQCLAPSRSEDAAISDMHDDVKGSGAGK